MFSDEEQAIIRSRKLKEYVVLKCEPDMLTVERLGAKDAAQFAETYHLRITDLASGKGHIHKVPLSSDITLDVRAATLARPDPFSVVALGRSCLTRIGGHECADFFDHRG